MGAEAITVADVLRFYEPSPTTPPQNEESKEAKEWRHKQWTERAKGLRKPNKITIEGIDERCPGSSTIFNLALWPVLRTDWELNRSFLEASKMLPEFQNFQFELQAKKLFSQSVMSYINTLKQRGTLDDLACLLLLLRQANNTNQFHRAATLSKCVNRVLLLQAGWLCIHGLLNPIVEYIDKEFFLKIPSPRGSTSAYTYFHQLQYLTKTLSHYLPGGVDNEIDVELWHRGAELALTDVESL